MKNFILLQWGHFLLYNRIWHASTKDTSKLYSSIYLKVAIYCILYSCTYVLYDDFDMTLCMLDVYISLRKDDVYDVVSYYYFYKQDKAHEVLSRT